MAEDKKKDSIALSELTSVSPIDGRYGSKTAPLRAFFSEYGLIKYRIKAEVEWLRHMSCEKSIEEVKPISAAADDLLKQLLLISVDDAKRVKEFEKTTNHDVKSIEYFLKEKFEHSDELKKVCEFVHFACTSEDINNLAYGMIFRDAFKEVIYPMMLNVIREIAILAKKHAAMPMLSRTHGQPATPTTFGKEMANYAYRLATVVQKGIKQVKYMGKFNGAVGNFNAHKVAYPSLDWPKIAKSFVEDRIGLTYQPYSTQIEQHDYLAEISDCVARFNTILLDLDMDMWSYVSREMLRLKTVANEVGSSTMPHKVNPIDFENSEGNLGLANALLKHFSQKLPISRLQRDLTDSTVLRNVGVAFGHCVLAYDSCLRGLSKIDVNEATMRAELDRHWAVLAEPIQTVLRKVGSDAPYEKLKALTRGQEVTQAVIQDFLRTLGISQKLKADELDTLFQLAPSNYVGIAEQLAREVEAVVAELGIKI